MLILLACLMGANASAQSSYVIEIRASSFEPQSITVPTGATVTWVNEDFRDRLVTGDNWPLYSGYLASGQRLRYQFNSPGNYYYHCTSNPSVRGVIVVMEESYQKPNYATTSRSSSSIPSMMTGFRSSKNDEPAYDSVSAKTASATEKCNICEQESGALAELYDRDQRSEFPFSKNLNDAGNTNALWIQGGSEQMQYAAVPKGGQVTLIATTLAEGNGYLYESLPNGQATREGYYFLPYNQIAFYADDVGRHTLTFSANGQVSNSIIIDVLEAKEPSSDQQIRLDQQYQRQSYQQERQSYAQQETQQQPSYPQDYQTNFQQQDSWQQRGLLQEDLTNLGYSSYPQQDRRQSNYQEPVYGQQVYTQQSLGQEDYGQKDSQYYGYQQQDEQSYYQEPYYDQGAYQQQITQQDYSQANYVTSRQAAVEEDLLARQRSFWQNSAVKLDSNGLLTLEGLTGTEYYLQPSNTNVMTRGQFFDGVLYILVANPNGVTNTVIVDPQLGDWNMQDIEILYGDLTAAKIESLMQIDVPAFGSGLIIVQPPRKRYSFSVGPKPQSSFVAGGRTGYSTSSAQRPGYSVSTGRRQSSFSAGPKPAYSFRIGY
jgi:plastocyanin